MEGIAHLDSLYFNRIAIKSGAIAGGIYYDKVRQAPSIRAGFKITGGVIGVVGRARVGRDELLLIVQTVLIRLTPRPTRCSGSGFCGSERGNGKSPRSSTSIATLAPV